VLASSPALRAWAHRSSAPGGACDAHSAATSDYFVQFAIYFVQFAIIVLLFCTAIAAPEASVMLQFS
jgi:hypothetical protein